MPDHDCPAAKAAQHPGVPPGTDAKIPPPERRSGRPGLQLDRESLVALTRPAPFALMACTLWEWGVIVLCIVIAEQLAAWWATAIAIGVIATRQHALLMLMHEFSHHQLSRTRRLLNDSLGDLFTALPFGITVSGFRRNHLAHHRAPCTVQDPNWTHSLQQPRFQFPISRRRMVWTLALHCLGFYTLQDLKRYLFDGKMAVETPRATQVRQWLFYAGVLGIAFAFDVWLLIAVYWIVPMLTVLMALLYLRDVGEHFAMPRAGHEAARNMVCGPLESWLIAPHAVGYHADHHLYPAVPFCRLKRLHAELRRLPTYRHEAVITRGYFTGLLREAAACLPPGSTSAPRRHCLEEH